MIHQIGPGSFDDESGTLSAHTDTRRLEDRAARALALLCCRRGEIVTRDDLLQDVWGGRSVSANSVAIVIGDLRRALDDDTQASRYIVTIAKRGYRLAPETVPAPPVNRLRRGLVIAIGSGLALAVAGAVIAVRRSRHPLRIVVEPMTNATGQTDFDSLARALNEVIVDHASTFENVEIVRDGQGDLRLTARLIVWDGLPTASLSLKDESSGIIRWSAMAEGQAGTLATLTSAKLDELGRRLHDF